MSPRSLGILGISLILAACGGGGGGGSGGGSATTYHVGGNISGLGSNKTVVLQNNLGNDLPVSSNGGFTFTTPLADTAVYSVNVKTNPSGQTCVASANTGTIATAPVTSVVINCSNTSANTVGGSFSGLLAGEIVTLQNNGVDTYPVNGLAGGNGTFTFPTPLAQAAPYNVSVIGNPFGKTCTASNNAGTATASVTNVVVTCSAVSWTVSGTPSGLAPGESVSLQNNAGNDLTWSSNLPFTFATPVANGAGYYVSVKTNPGTKTCTASVNAGVANAAVNSVVVTSSATTVTVGGHVTGLVGSANNLVLQNNAGDDLVVGGSGQFTFPTAVATGAGYNVSVKTSPSGKSCVATVNAGLANAAVNTVVVTCNTIFTVGGNASGLVGNETVTLQNNGGDNLTLSATDQTFTFATPLLQGAHYKVSVLTPPAGKICTASNNNGWAGATVTTVSVICSSIPNSYSVSGGITGLGPFESVTLENNGLNNTPTPFGANSFAFTNNIATGAGYNVSVVLSPTGKTCSTNLNAGTINGAPVTNVAVICKANAYAVSVSVVGLVGSANNLVLQNNAGDDLVVAASGAYTFATPVADTADYKVSVRTNPAGKTCTAANNTGSITGAAVNNVTVSCN